MMLFSARSDLGRGANTAPMPTWLPAAGEIAVLTNTNGGLSNHFIDTVDTALYSTAYAKEIVNAYSGQFKCRDWGLYGGSLIRAGGHSSTNYNALIMLEYGYTSITFVVVMPPTDYFGVQAQNDIDDVSALIDWAHCENTQDGKLPGVHSYANGDVVGPEWGGATGGTYYETISVAPAKIGIPPGGTDLYSSPHKLDLGASTDDPTTRAWARVGTNTVGPQNSSTWNGPVLSAFVGSQMRIYQVATVTANLKWFDMTAQTYNTGSASNFLQSATNGHTGAMFWAEAPDLLVCMQVISGAFVVQYAACTSDPVIHTATLDTSLSMPDGWSCACWVKDINRIVFVGVVGDDTHAYEIEIPADPTNDWIVTARAFGTGQTFAPTDGTLGYFDSGKKWSYDEKIKAIVYYPKAAGSGDDTVYVYKPVGT
jgi:hypothetical protein